MTLRFINSDVIDSDGDGVNDYRELYDGTNPFDPKSFEPLSVGLVAHYPFNGNANDESGFGKHLTDRFNAEFSNSYTGAGSALRTTSSTGAMTLKKSGIQGNQARTYSAWIKSDGPQPWPQGYFLSLGEGGLGNQSALAIGSQYDRGLPFAAPLLGMDNYDANVQIVSTAPFHGNWNHVAVTYYEKLAYAEIYVNGVQVDVTLPAGYSDPERMLNTADGGISISRFLDPSDTDGPQGRGFAGLVDNVRIYNRALSAAEVSQLYAKESGQPNMVLVQGGTLPVGSGLANQTVSAFQIARFETTWNEWKKVRDWAKLNGYNFDNNGVAAGENYPVADVSWYDAVKWCNAKSQMEGFKPVYLVNGSAYRTGQNSNPTFDVTANGYRLPLVKEWEWAAFGGVASQKFTYSGGNNIGEVAWYVGNSLSKAWPVGTKKSNELGIFDMTGNVSEWCWDVGLYGFDKRVKGADYLSPPEGCLMLLDLRGGGGPDYHFGHFGFRYARNAIGDMVTVQGGTLPAGSALANQTVQTFQIGRTEVTWDEWQSVPHLGHRQRLHRPRRCWPRKRGQPPRPQCNLV
jgi:formylglycine-generating enzyme required for sulfatase activity